LRAKRSNLYAARHRLLRARDALAMTVGKARSEGQTHLHRAANCGAGQGVIRLEGEAVHGTWKGGG
jgi:hypothetical protein